MLMQGEATGLETSRSLDLKRQCSLFTTVRASARVVRAEIETTYGPARSGAPAESGLTSFPASRFHNISSVYLKSSALTPAPFTLNSEIGNIKSM